MSELTNDPDECLNCGHEYDALLEINDDVMYQTQGKANACIVHRGSATFVFLHYGEKYF